MAVSGSDAVPEAAARTRQALDTLAEVLEQASGELAELAARTRGLRAQFVEGLPLSELVPTEPRPLIITLMAELQERLSEAGSGLRRAQAEQLRAEGLSQREIAELFGVSRQRVGMLLAGRDREA